VFLAGFIGMSVPIVGAGVALAEGVSPRMTLLAFAIAVAIGIVASAIKLLGGPRARAAGGDGRGSACGPTTRGRRAGSTSSDVEEYR
jgi:hypothetical protein